MRPQPYSGLGYIAALPVGGCVFLVCISLLRWAYADEIPGLAIQEVQICQDVKDHEPLNLLNDPEHRIKDKPVWVWLLLSGTEESLSHLKSGKQLPLKTVWIYCGNDPTPKAEDGTSYDEQPMSLKELFARYPAHQRKALPLGRIAKSDALRGEAQDSDSNVWVWRTASKKIHLSPGFYRIYFYLTQGGRLKLPDDSEFLAFNYEP